MSSLKLVDEKQILSYKAPDIAGKFVQADSLMHEIISLWQRRGEALDGVPTTNWNAFNQAFGGIRPGEVILLSGDTGSGKSTWAMQWLLNLVHQGKGGLIISLELKAAQIARKLAWMINRKPFNDMTEIDIAGLKAVLEKMNLWVFDHYRPVTEALLNKAIEYAAFEKNCSFILVDHLDYIQKYRARDSRASDAELIGDLMRRLSTTAKKANTTVLLLVHPAKMNVKGTSRREVNMDELKGSSSLKQEADSVMTIFQPKADNRSEAIVRFHKIRDDGFSKWAGSFVRFHYNAKTMEITETSLLPEWGKAK